MQNASLSYFFLSFFTILIILISCKRSTEPIHNVESPVANAGPDQTTQVGSYAILNASSSSPGEEVSITWWEWTQDENNPEEVNVFSGDTDSIQTIGFIKEGTFKFSLVVNNGIQNSKPDEVVVTVLPRNHINFTDPNLEVHIRYALKKPTEELTNEILAGIDSVVSYDVIVKDITSLEGIEKCVNLDYLTMGHQRIVNLLPLVNLTKLTYLNLTQNRHIKDISPLASLTQLRYLDLDSNEITDISPLVNLTKLTYLNLQLNIEIEDFSVLVYFENLQELWLANSPIKDISFVSELDKLYLLWLAKCDISDITPIANLTNLSLLYLNWNKISDISQLVQLSKLERLYLRDNQIVDISPLENLVKLNLLILSKNQISNILPLVNNRGLGTGDLVDLSQNPLDQISINEYIPELINRGVQVLGP